jgi:DNA helicase HerA-like ATPase
MAKTVDPAATDGEDFRPEPVAAHALERIEEVAEEVGGPYAVPPGTEGAVGFTHFDTPASEDSTVVVLLAKENMEKLPSQAIVEIRSLPNEREGVPGRKYLGAVIAGPFAEPDGLRADSSIVVATTVQGRIFLPRYHGRAFVQLLGEEVNGQLVPPRYRPRPNSPVFSLSTDETAKVLRCGGNARLGIIVGQEDIEVGIPTDRKSILPRHLGILGTTGGGKSTTVAGLVYQLQKAGVATVLIDTEGEYTEMDQPTDDPVMKTALDQRGLLAHGVPKFAVGHLVGRETSRATELGQVRSFSLRFSDLSPHAVMEILDLPDAQQERFLKTYDTLKLVFKDLAIFPKKGEEQRALEIDEMETGWPRMTLLQLIDLASVFADMVSAGKDAKAGRKKDDDEDDPLPSFTDLRSPELKGQEAITRKWAATAKAPGSLPSWRGLLGKLWRVHRLKLFDNPDAEPLNHAGLIKKGWVSVIDLSDTDSPQVNNLVIADVLRGLWKAQEASFAKARKEAKPVTPVVVIIEEAHEFLSEQRINQMQVLFQQVARIAKRGRKRWLGLVFVTQLPQHLPNEVLGLINNYIVHKIADSGVVDRLKRSISGIDKGLWNMVSGLAPGQALVSLTHMTRPRLVSIDPTPCRLQLVE